MFTAPQHAHRAVRQPPQSGYDQCTYSELMDVGNQKRQ
jgi:hypothetical protein